MYFPYVLTFINKIHRGIGSIILLLCAEKSGKVISIFMRYIRRYGGEMFDVMAEGYLYVFTYRAIVSIK